MQEKTCRATIEALEAGQSAGDAALDPVDGLWERPFAAALGENDPSAVARLLAETVALVEEPYGEETPLAARRFGDGPDLPPTVWPSNTPGMRHPFLMQINLTKISAACGPMWPLPDDGLSSFFVHADALLADVVYPPPGAALVRHSMTDTIIEASAAAVGIASDLDQATQPCLRPHKEGDMVTAKLMADGRLTFVHTLDPFRIWAGRRAWGSVRGDVG